MSGDLLGTLLNDHRSLRLALLNACVDRAVPKPATPENAPVAATNLPGRGDPDLQNQQTSVAPSRKMDAVPPAQPAAARPAPAIKRTLAAGEEQTIRVAGVDFPFVYVPTGPFQMGSNDYDREKPIHTMPVEAFWLGKTPITNAQFRPFVDAGGPFVDASGYTNEAFWTKSGWQWRTDKKIIQPAYWADSKWNTPQQPVIGVSWYEAVAYAAWLAQTTGQAIRLPTEAEWEKGARGTDSRKYPWGNDAPGKNRCNFNGNEGKTTPVGQYPVGASPYGALDMAGNVWEWTATKWVVANYENYANVVDNDKGRNATRALRGGSWDLYSNDVRSANRGWDLPNSRNNLVGFRLVVCAPGS